MDLERPMTLAVPVREDEHGVMTLSVCRRPDGTRVGLAFSDAARLRAAMGPGQRHVALGLSALRSMLTTIGVHVVQVDPGVVARPADARRAAS